MNWTERENEIVLDAIEQGVNVQHVIEIIREETSRSEKSVIRRLKRIGYLRSCGRSFAFKQGFVR